MPTNYKQSFKQNYKENAELCIYNCGWQICEKNYTWGPGVRDHYLLHFIVKGKGKYTVNGKAYNVGQGEMFYSKPGELIMYTADSTQPWEYYWVGFNGPYANKLTFRLPFKNNLHVHKCLQPEKIKKSIYNIFNFRGSEPYSEVMMVGRLYVLLANLIKEAQISEPKKFNLSSQYVNNAIKYIQFNYSQDIGIDDIAKSVGVSRSHLYRVFVNNIGRSPVDYLTEYRINEACYLLKNSQLSIAEIAVSVGFYDQFYFSRVFKKVKKVPPSKYVASQDSMVEITQPE